MTKQYFGTDGIRGRVGQFPITPEFCLRLGWAVGKVFGRQGDCHILIGKDTRISGYMMESVLESGLASAGANVTLLTVMPTPAIAYLTRTLRADAGIVISASHNPYFDNGIKFFDGHGNKLDDAVEDAIEAQLQKEMVCVESDSLGKAARIEDAPGRYIEFCKATVDRQFSLSGLRLVIDCAHGATYHIAPRVFEELGADVHVIGSQPDGTNINQQCGSAHPEALAAAVLERAADVGIAFDGDGDRVIMVDGQGEIVDGDELLYIMARHRAADDRLGGGVVGTVMTNFGCERALGELNIPFARAQVGDRYVLECLRSKGWRLGGEPSGHLLCLDLTTTGDAIVAALQVLVPLVEGERSLAELKSGMQKLPQAMLNVAVDHPAELVGDARVIAAVKNASRALDDHGRVLVRPSGTEPLVRVMVEGNDAGEVAALAQALARDLEAQVGQGA